MPSPATLSAVAPPTTIHFSRGVPPLEAIPTQDLAAIARRLVMTPASNLFQYAPSHGFIGDRSLRESLAQLSAAAADEIFIGNGSLQVLDLVAALLITPKYNTVIVERPTYDRSIRIFNRHGGKVVGIPLERDGIDVALLAEQIRRKPPALIYLIPDFQNPTGVTTSAAKRRQIAQLAAEFEIPIIDDTPYRELRFEGEPLPSFREVSSGARVITIGSLSKTLSPGLRIGYAIADAPFARRLSDLAADTYLSPAPLCQSIAAECFRTGLVDRNIAQVRELIRPRWAAAMKSAIDVFGDACICLPKGGYFLGVLIDSELPEPDIIAAASCAGVNVTPGSSFFPQEELPPPGKMFLRLPFHALDPPDFASGLNILIEIIRPAGSRRTR